MMSLGKGGGGEAEKDGLDRFRSLAIVTVNFRVGVDRFRILACTDFRGGGRVLPPLAENPIRT